MDRESPPFFEVTPSDRSGWVVIVTIIFLVYSILAVAAKIVSRMHLTALRSFDWIIATAVLMAMSQSVLLVRSCYHGLGQHEADLQESSLTAAQKDLYAASLLAILVHGLSKVSVSIFIQAINARSDLKIVNRALFAVIALWSAISLLLAAFRCSLPNPWQEGNESCLDALAVSIGINVFNILTDLGLVVLPVVMMWGVHTSTDVKVRVMSLFSCRLLVPILVILEIVYLNKRFESNDITWSVVDSSMWAQIAMNMSIVTACIPSLKGVIDMFWSGASLFTIPGQYSSQEADGTFKLQSILPSQFRTYQTGSVTRTKNGDFDPRPSQNEVISAAGDLRQRAKSKPTRSESQVSLRENAITRTVEYEIYHEPGSPPPAPGAGRTAVSDSFSQDSVEPEERLL